MSQNGLSWDEQFILCLLLLFNYKMATKELNIKNRTYYFYNDLSNIVNFEASNLKLDKKTSMGLDIYCTGYVDKKSEWNVNSVNPLYLMINRIDGFVEEKKWQQIFKHC